MGRVAFTPGPWFIHPGQSDPDAREITNSKNQNALCYMVATAWGGGADVTATLDANARLIAAAPEMYEALREYLDWGPMTGSDRDLFNGMFSKLLAKIDGAA